MTERDELIKAAFDDLVAAAPQSEAARLDARRQAIARRQRRLVRGTAVGTLALLAAAIVALAFIGRGDRRETVVVNPTVSTEATTSTGSPTSTSTTVEQAVGITLADWVAEQMRVGRTTGRQQGTDGTDARLLVADGPTDSAYALVLPTGETFPLPQSSDPADPITLARLGERPAIVDSGVAGATVWLLDPTPGTWTRALEVPSPSSFEAVWRVTSLDGQIALAAQTIRDAGQGQVAPDEFAGTVIHADLTIEAMSPPPDGIFYEVTSTVGAFALVMGHDNSAGDSAPLIQPWQYDATTNTWTAIPVPAWLDCTQPCQWAAPHEFGDRILEIAAGDEVVKRVPGGTIGAYTPSTRTWRRLDDSPLDLTTPSARVVAGHVVVLPLAHQLSENPPGAVAVLDIATGTWTTATVPTPPKSETDYLIPDVRVAGTVAIVQLRLASASLDDYTPDLAYDTATGQWRSPTADETALWPSLLQSYQDVPLDRLVPPEST
jgi:hypothetical protein